MDVQPVSQPMGPHARMAMHDAFDAEHPIQLQPIEPELNEDLWRRGVCFHLLDEAQQEVYEHWYDLPTDVLIVVAMIARRFGKTSIYASICVELALRNPGSLYHYTAATTVQVRNMLIPVFSTMLDTCPDDLKPKLVARDATWVFPNGSKIVMGGIEDRAKCDRMRGQHSDGVFCDEAGYCPELEYFVNSVATPMLQGRKGARITMYSNAPYSPSHDIVSFANRARETGGYIHRTVYDSPRYSRKDIELFSQAAGGFDSAEWRREYLAEIVVDENYAVIPEWASREDKPWVRVEDSFRARMPQPEDEQGDIKPPLVREVPRPQYFDIYTFMDPGFSPDLTSVLAAYWDYREARLVVENELEIQNMTTDQLAKGIAELEHDTWNNYWTFTSKHHGWASEPYLRIMDVGKQMRHDLGALHGLRFTQANNQDLHSQINRLRQLVRNGKLVVHPRCKKLISHLRAAYWDSGRQVFARPSRKPSSNPNETYYGHFDHLSALQLGHAHVNKHNDPYPSMPLGISHHTHHVSHKRRAGNQPGEDGFAELGRLMTSRWRKAN